jgi:hypothetical protein
MTETRNINYLLRKYNNDYTNGEQRSDEYNKKMKQKQRLYEKLQLAEELFLETPFHLTKDDKEQVKHLIRMYPNFRKLHGKASNEQIILSFIFYTKIPYDNQIKLDKYEITQKYQLTHNTFEIIICRLALEYLKEVYIIPTIPKDKNHEILLKGK